MKIFLTGGTGFIGSEVLRELISAGHEVTGLSRNEVSDSKLLSAGAKVLRGDIENLESLKSGADWADAVIHCAFVHNFGDFVAATKTDKAAIDAIGEALVDSNKILIVTSGVPTGASGHIVTEDDEVDINFPRLSEQTALPYASKGVRVCIVRPSRIVHGKGNFGFISMLAGIAKEKGTSAYVGDGQNRLHSVHVLDLAKLYLLALEKGVNGKKYQAVGDYAIPYKDIAEFIAKSVNVPVISITPDEIMPHFGFVGLVAGADNPASSDITQKTLGWKPTHESLIEDLKANFKM